MPTKGARGHHFVQAGELTLFPTHGDLVSGHPNPPREQCKSQECISPDKTMEDKTKRPENVHARRHSDEITTVVDTSYVLFLVRETKEKK